MFLVDYSIFGRPPCYVSTVNNVPYISRCLSHYLNNLRKGGVSVESCIGHSLGAVICGLLKDYLQFELNKIIGNARHQSSIQFDTLIWISFKALDPALPLIFGNFRLKRSSARSVHVLQTNAGYFGDVGNIGHVNVCVNDGFIQPYCSKTSSKQRF